MYTPSITCRLSLALSMGFSLRFESEPDRVFELAIVTPCGACAPFSSTGTGISSVLDHELLHDSLAFYIIFIESIVLADGTVSCCSSRNAKDNSNQVLLKMGEKKASQNPTAYAAFKKYIL